MVDVVDVVDVVVWLMWWCGETVVGGGGVDGMDGLLARRLAQLCVADLFQLGGGVGSGGGVRSDSGGGGGGGGVGSGWVKEVCNGGCVWWCGMVMVGWKWWCGMVVVRSGDKQRW